VHLHNRAWRNVLCAIALVTFALPLATPLATPTQAQTATPAAIPAGCTPTPIGSTAGSSACKVAATPNAGPAIFNPIGISHTVTFTCDADIFTEGLIGPGGTTAAAAVAPGCYNVSASAQDITTGSAVSIQSATCGGTAVTTAADGTANCAGTFTPLCLTWSITWSPTPRLSTFMVYGRRSSTRLRSSPSDMAWHTSFAPAGCCHPGLSLRGALGSVRICCGACEES